MVLSDNDAVRSGGGRRARWIVGAGVVVAGAVVVLAALIWFFVGQGREPSDQWASIFALLLAWSVAAVPVVVWMVRQSRRSDARTWWWSGSARRSNGCGHVRSRRARSTFPGRAVRLWSVATGRRIATLDPVGWGAHPPERIDVLFSPGGRLLAIGGGDEYPAAGWVRVWDVAAGRLTAGLDHIMATILAFSPDERSLATSMWQDRTVRLWDVTTGQLTSTVGRTQLTSTRTELAFDPDGRMLITTEPETQNLQLWNLATGQLTATLGFVRAESSPHAGILATVDHIGGTVRLWDTRTGRSIATLDRAVTGVAFARDGSLLVTIAGVGKRRVLRLWDPRTGRATGTLGDVDTNIVDHLVRSRPAHTRLRGPVRRHATVGLDDRSGDRHARLRARGPRLQPGRTDAGHHRR